MEHFFDVRLFVSFVLIGFCKIIFVVQDLLDELHDFLDDVHDGICEYLKDMGWEVDEV